MHEDTIKITVEVWVRRADFPDAVAHLTKATLELPMVAEQIHFSDDRDERPYVGPAPAMNWKC